MRVTIGLFLFAFCLCVKCYAGEAHILEVKIERESDKNISVSATVQHDDDGWEHYADRWEILDGDGKLLDTRVLMHPHSKEPFTRSLPAAKIPAGTKKIRVRAHDSVHGYGGEEIVAEITAP